MKKTDNEIIDDFMGIDFSQFQTVSCYTSNKYDESWDKLIPVVAKCFDSEFGDNYEEWKKCNQRICAALVVLSIEGVYKYVVEFIHWHNAQKIQNPLNA